MRGKHVGQQDNCLGAALQCCKRLGILVIASGTADAVAAIEALEGDATLP